MNFIVFHYKYFAIILILSLYNNSWGACLKGNHKGLPLQYNKGKPPYVGAILYGCPLSQAFKGVAKWQSDRLNVTH
jgi:hypothetical protein